MKWPWWILGGLALLVLLYFTALPGDFPVGRDDDTGLAGTYTVNGVDPTGVEYSGTAVIIDVAGDGSADYEVEWIITNAIQTGRGSVDGSVFEVAWTATASARPGSGHTIYTVEPDGRLVGQRFVDGVDEPGTEELFPEP